MHRRVDFYIAVLFSAAFAYAEDNTTDPYVLCAEQYDACLIKCESTVSEDSACQETCEKTHEQCIERVDKKLQEY